MAGKKPKPGPKKKLGRISKIVDETGPRAIVLQAIRDGMPQRFAAQKAGITQQTLLNWLNRGKRESQGDYFTFLGDYKRAQAEAVDRNVKLIQVAAVDTWQAAAWWCERMFPDEFALNRTEVKQLKEQIAELIKAFSHAKLAGVDPEKSSTVERESVE